MPKIKRPILVNYKERIENGEFNDKKTKEEWLEINDRLLKIQSIMSKSSKQNFELSKQIQELNKKLIDSEVKYLQAYTKFQQLESYLTRNLRVISGRLTKIEMEVMNALKTFEWKGEKFDIDNIPNDWIKNEKYMNALDRLIEKVS